MCTEAAKYSYILISTLSTDQSLYSSFIINIY